MKNALLFAIAAGLFYFDPVASLFTLIVVLIGLRREIR